MSSFSDLRIVDNFYQTSGFFPMPTTLISTLCDDGMTSLGAYSLIFPYYIAGKNYYAMVLECRNNSNTALNLFKNGKCAINFIPDKRKYFKETVRLGFPGDTPQEKMSKCKFTLEDGLCAQEKESVRPKVVAEAFQVYECSWIKELDGAENDMWTEDYKGPYRDFNGITSETGAHFILKIDKILIKEKYKQGIIRGAKPGLFPKVPIDYGYRDNTHFWYTPHRKPLSVGIPKGRGTSLDVIIYAADRIDEHVKFTEDACESITKVPRIFLNRVLQACVNWAKERNIDLITAEHMKEINNKRSGEK